MTLVDQDLAEADANVVPLWGAAAPATPESAGPAEAPAQAPAAEGDAPSEEATPAADAASAGADRIEKHINREDAAFHRAHLVGLGLSLSNLWIGFGAMGLGAAAMAAAMAEPMLGVAVGAAFGFGIYAFIATVVGLRLGIEHERKVAQIQKVARLGAERIRIDDPSLVRNAMRDVLTEWMHSALLLRRLRETSFWYRSAVGAQVVLALALIAVFAALSPLPAEETALIAAAAAALTAIHGWREIRAGRERGLACALGDALDPTEALADRVEVLLEEVRTLRRHGREA